MSEIISRKIEEFLSMLPDDLTVRLLWSLLVVATTIVVIKIINAVLDRAIDRERRKSSGNESAAAGNMLISLGVLSKAVCFYGAILTAAVIILEVFQVKVFSTADVKNMGLIALKVTGVIVAARLAVKFCRVAIAQAFARKELKGGLIEDRRAQTMESLLKSGIAYIVYFLAGLMILQIFNINTGAILAGVGILGLAVGFGAQNLVRDVISGFFIIFEDQFAVGEYVEAGGAVGVVEEIGLRTCKIRKWTGQLHIIPNGEIKTVVNYNRGHITALAVVGIAYGEDVDRAMEVLRRECETAHREIPAIVEVPVVQGVVSLGNFSVNIRAAAPTSPGEQWAVERELLRRFKNALDREGIEIPHPRRVMQYREEYNL